MYNVKMYNLLGFIGLIVIIGIVFLIRKGFRSMDRSLNRNVFMKKTYQEQQRLTGTAWVMTASASIAEIKGQLRKYVTSETTAKKVVGNLYIAAEKDNQIVYRQGNSLATAFTALLTLSDNNGSVTGRLTIEQWMENNGVSTGTETMQTLIARVKDAFEAADPKTSIKELAK